MTMLEVKNIGISFGDLEAVGNFSLILKESELSGLIGPNDTGKTTIFNLLTGVYCPDKGSTRLDGRELTSRSIIETNQVGITKTFQNIQLFPNLSMLDNMETGLHNRYPYTTLGGVLRLPRSRVQEEEMNRRTTELLRVFYLEQFVDTGAENLPYGSQWELEIARILATESKLLLLDEPAAGMNSSETAELVETIQLVQKRFHMTIPLIEHDIKLASGICERLTTPNFGKVLKQGETQKVLHDPGVMKVYLGE